MATTTPNFGWSVPTSTDLVKDGATAIETLGDAIDASLVDLKGGTSGQYLTKNSNTDMDFTWVTSTADIEGVTVTSPLTGGGTSGTVTIGIQASSTTQSGAVQLSDSTSSTSTTLAATANAVKTSYDLAAAAIPKSTVTTAGDLIYATGASTVTRRAIGSEGQALTVSSGVPAWTTLSSGAYTSLASGSLSSSALALTSINGGYRDLVLILENWQVSSALRPVFTLDNISSNTAYALVQTWANATAGTGVAQIASNSTSLWISPFTAWTGSNGNCTIITLKNYASTSSKKYGTVEGVFYANVSQAATTHMGNLFLDTTSAIDRIDFAGSQFSAGSYVLYGVK